MAAVWDLSIHKGSDLLLLLALADSASDDGHSYPGIGELVRKTRVSRSTVIRALERLEAAGEIFIRHNRRRGNQYLVILGLDEGAIAEAMKMRFNWTEATIRTHLKAIAERRGAAAISVNLTLQKSQNETYQNDTNGPLSVNLTLQKSHSDTSEVSRVTLDPLKADDDESRSSSIQGHHHQSPPPPTLTPHEKATLGAEVRGIGLARAVRERLYEMDAERALALVLHAKGEASRSPAGLLRRMVEAGDDPAAPYVEQARARLDPAPPARTVSQRPPAAPPRPPDTSLEQRPGNGLMSVGDIWHAVLGQLELQLNRATYETCLQGAVADRYADGVLWIRPSSTTAAAGIARLQPVIDGVISGIAGVPLAVRCVEGAPS